VTLPIGPKLHSWQLYVDALMTLAKLFIKEIQGMIEMVHVKHELNIALSFKIIK